MPNGDDLRFSSGFRLCLILKMSVSEGYLFFKTTILWVLFDVKALRCLLLFCLDSVFFFHIGCDVSTSKVRKSIMTLLPNQVTLSHATHLKTPLTPWPADSVNVHF